MNIFVHVHTHTHKYSHRCNSLSLALCQSVSQSRARSLAFAGTWHTRPKRRNRRRKNGGPTCRERPWCFCRRPPRAGAAPHTRPSLRRGQSRAPWCPRPGPWTAWVGVALRRLWPGRARGSRRVGTQGAAHRRGRAGRGRRSGGPPAAPVGSTPYLAEDLEKPPANPQEGCY